MNRDMKYDYIVEYIKQNPQSLLAIAYRIGYKNAVLRQYESLDIDAVAKCGKCIVLQKL